MTTVAPADVRLGSDVLKKLGADFNQVIEDPARQYARWGENLFRHLDSVQKAPLEVRSSSEFQNELWTSERIAATGQGHVSVEAALADPAFRQWLAERSVEALPSAPEAQRAHLQALYEELEKRLRTYGPRTPRLKIFRVLASFFPRHFTTVADVRSLDQLHRAMFGPQKSDEVSRHQNVLRRLDEVLGPVDGDLGRWVRRMMFPWFLVEHLDQSRKADATGKLEPLPALRRRRGMTAIGGLYSGVVRALDFIAEGVPQDELVAFLRQENPRLKDSSLSVAVNVLRSELGVIERVDNLVVPTELGRKLAESQDPSVLAGWLLTRILVRVPENLTALVPEILAA